MTPIRDAAAAWQAAFTDKDGELTNLGRVFVKHFAGFCHYNPTSPDVGLFKTDEQGRIDPYELARRAGRREVYEELVRVLNLSLRDTHNLRGLRNEDRNPADG